MTVQHLSPTDRTPSSGLTGLLAQLLMTNDEAIAITTDRSGRITWMSPRAERLLNPRSLEAHVLYLPEQLMASRDPRSEWTLTPENGRRVTLRLTIMPLLDQDGETVAFGAVGTDITDKQEYRDRLRSAEDREREADRRSERLEELKREFAETAGHELRTPLTSISGYLELLEDEVPGSSADALGIIAVMRRNCSRLESLVDDLRILCSMDFGARCATDEVDLVAVVREAARQARPLMATTRTHLILDVPPAAILVRGDNGQLEQLVGNLVSNGAKFTDSGGLVRCRVEAADQGCRITIRDDGIGIPAGEEDFVFDRFYRGSNAQGRESQGAGLGLTIVRGIVAAHGGTISARTGPEAGTTVTVTLPLARP